jgi:hypothetical protein
MELIIFGIMGKEDELTHGMELEIPDNNETLVTGVTVSGLFTEIEENKPKKTKGGKK